MTWSLLRDSNVASLQGLYLPAVVFSFVLGCYLQHRCALVYHVLKFRHDRRHKLKLRKLSCPLIASGDTSSLIPILSPPRDNGLSMGTAIAVLKEEAFDPACTYEVVLDPVWFRQINAPSAQFLKCMLVLLALPRDCFLIEWRGRVELA